MANVMNVCIPCSNGTLAVGTTNILGFYVPSDAVGGGITITKVDYASNVAIAAASAPVFECVNLTSAGALAGTIATVLASAAFGAGTSRVGTLATSTGVFVDAGQAVAIRRLQTAANADTSVITAAVQYVMGR
jgi:hypothetical protein